MECLKSVSQGVEVRIKVVPGASRDRIVGQLGDALKIQVAAPPEKGKANKAVSALLARVLGVNPRDIEVSAGHTSPRKTLLIRNVSIERIRSALE